MLGEEYFKALLEFIQANGEWIAVAMFFLAFGESLVLVSLLLPFWAVFIGLGATIGISSPDFPAIWIAASVGAALGDMVSYWLGLKLHDRIARTWPISKNPRLLQRSKAFLDQYGAWAVIFGRFSGPLRATIPFVAGASKMNQFTFQCANWFSAFVWTFVLLVFGEGIGAIMSRVLSSQ
jgi:membrane protein DedA with SNARE-associated domain